MMILRFCLCCFGGNRNSSNDPKRVLANQSTSVASKQRNVYTVPEDTGDARDVSHDDDDDYCNYEEALSAEKPNWMGSVNSLTGSVANLTGITNLIGSSANLTASRMNLTASRISLTSRNANLAGSCTNLSGSRANILISGQQFIHPPSEFHDETDIASDLEQSVAVTPQKDLIVKKRHRWRDVLTTAKLETLKCPSLLQSLTSRSMTTLPTMLPTITVGGSSSSRIGSSENTTRPGVHTLPKCEREVKSMSSSPKTSNSWLKSQSMLDVTCIEPSESSKISRSAENLAQEYGLDASLYGNTHLSKSMEAVNRSWTSMDEFVTENGFVDQSYGTVHFVPFYDSNTKKLIIRIEKVDGLAPKGVNRSKYDCVIKLTMLPHEKQIKFSKTIPAHSTLDLEECVIFNVNHPSNKILRISVYDTQFLGKYDAVGHALFYVEDALTHEQQTHTLKLYRQSVPDIQAGCIKIILNYDKQTELLHVFMDEAYNLRVLPGKCNSYLKLTQYSFGRKVREKKSSFISAAKQLRYKFTVDLKIDSRALQNSFIVISVKMQTRLRHVLIGQVILGPFFYAQYGRTLTPWGRALINQETVSHIFRLYQ